MPQRPHDRPPRQRMPRGRRWVGGRGGRTLQGFRRKNWDRHVSDLAEMAASAGFQALRDEVVGLAEPDPADRVLDIGAGTGLLTLALAPQVAEVWALDVSGAMCQYLASEVDRRGLENVHMIESSATHVPLPDQGIDLIVSNYCFHHLRDRDKERALAECWRVLRPGGRLVFADMMFRVGLMDRRNRAVVAGLLGRLARRGPGGLLRIAKNGFRYLTGRWEQPADVGWWQAALDRAGFTAADVRPLEHEGGIATARRPPAQPAGVSQAADPVQGAPAR